MTQPKTLADLRVGDEVAVISRYDHVTLANVSKVTPSQIHIDARKFRKDDGQQIGVKDRYLRSRLSVKADDMTRPARDAKMHACKSAIKSFDFSRAGITQMRAAADQAEAFLRGIGKWGPEE